MLLLKILRTSKLLFVFVIYSFVICVLSISFYKGYYKSISALTTWSNCQSKAVVYDKRSYDDNCYIYYKDKISFDLSNSNNSKRIKTNVYQFLEGVKYNNYSLLNSRNVVSGTYKDLTEYEIAIPSSMSKNYSLFINDKLYYEHDIYKIVYIFSDFYNIKEADINSNETVVFVGASCKNLIDNYNYATFKDDSGMYNEVYGFNKIMQSFIGNIVLYGLVEFVIVSFISVLVYLFTKKQYCKELIALNNSGIIKNYYTTLLGVNFYLLCIPCILSFIVLLVKKQLIHGLILLCSSAIMYVFFTFLYKSKTRR